MTAHPAKVDVPRLPRELAGSVPREVRLTGGGIAAATAAVAIALGAIVAAILMSLSYASASAKQQLHEREGLVTDAEIVQVVVRRGEHPRRTVTYRYEVDGHRYTGRTTLRENDRRQMAQGGRVRVAYVESDPETSWMAGYGSTGFPLWIIPLTVFSLLAAAVAIGRSVRRQWILLSEGRVAEARVTRVKKMHSDKQRAFRVTYEFRTISGATRTSRCEIGKAAPAVGALIPILYHRDTPEWTAAYPLSMVKTGRTVN